MTQKLVLIKGAGDIATAVAHKLFRSGFKIIMTDIDKPTCVRRYVSFANCIYEGEWQVEGVKAKKACNIEEANLIISEGAIPVIPDATASIKNIIKPVALIDAILAKKNTGTTINDAPIVIGLGPGFTAGIDVDIVIETNRGHNLGRIIYEGKGEEYTGIPGKIGGYTRERVIRSATEGVVKAYRKIGDIVKKGDIIAYIGDSEIRASIDGVIRGLIQTGTYVTKDYKIGDIDPRGNIQYVSTISEKGRCIAGGVLEALLHNIYLYSLYY
ncbi:EF2563 family selenium-dependent molybdenum hydroxylase system protein [Alkaliphilus pronyensis]|uniref:EF2563 family selenium-dependent molybdenum hydroxylase system protein n=1 Tax=Alkaliphilus pronyensis TaxID=1482732 RepID=A0A6I0F8R6_9FIRM|nr:selenium-dependent molybdenum cofactor biosynthesis protein YqeB [Alkaliphilus pronyensis]KAB3532446.1 EF2563 family selenium-dependent molybdenum hydroxylase system protein [Alkaliphilus pronyensis]